MLPVKNKPNLTVMDLYHQLKGQKFESQTQTKLFLNAIDMGNSENKLYAFFF